MRSRTFRFPTRVSACLPNAPVQARWAHAQRAGPAAPNPPTASFSRLLAGFVTTTLLDFMSVLTYIVCGDEPTRETPGLVARRDQDATVHRRGPGGSRPPPAASAAGLEGGHAPLETNAHHCTQVPRAAGQRCSKRLADRVSSRCGCGGRSRHLRQDYAHDTRPNDCGLQAPIEIVRRR